jgi:hypothetical protein
MKRKLPRPWIVCLAASVLVPLAVGCGHYAKPTVPPASKVVTASPTRSSPTSDPPTTEAPGSKSARLWRTGPPAPFKPSASGAAQVVDIHGLLLERAAEGQPWKAVKAPSDIPPGALLVALPEAKIASGDGAVWLRMTADLARRLKEPIYESAIIVNKNPDVDLDFTLDRGLVVVHNEKEKGSAKVRVRAADHFWDILLEQPGSSVGLCLFGRHAPGIRAYIQDATKPFKPDDAPTLELYALVIQGEAELTAGQHTFAMNEPPGPALFRWSNIDGDDKAPERLEERPDFLKPWTAEEQKKAEAVYEKAQKWGELPREQALALALKSDDPLARRLAVTCAGATDDLPALISALNDDQHPEVREHAIVILRHWLGRKTGQDEKLYNLLVDKGQLKPAQAAGAIQLLHGFTEAERETPELYGTLLAFFRHEKLPVRELIRFHLYRLVPAGKSIEYDAAWPAEKREEAYKQWKKLIPDGELPPKPKAEPPAKP